MTRDEILCWQEYLRYRSPEDAITDRPCRALSGLAPVCMDAEYKSDKAKAMIRVSAAFGVLGAGVGALIGDVGGEKGKGALIGLCMGTGFGVMAAGYTLGVIEGKF